MQVLSLKDDIADLVHPDTGAVITGELFSPRAGGEGQHVLGHPVQLADTRVDLPDVPAKWVESPGNRIIGCQLSKVLLVIE